MEEIGVDVAHLGPSDIRQVKKIFRLIERDEGEPYRAVAHLKTLDFKIDVARLPSSFTPVSTAIAESFLPDISLRHLSAWYVKHILVNNIEKRMFEVNKQTEAGRRVIWVEPALKFPTILSVEGRKLKGLGDVELFSLGELNSQTARRQFSIIMPVTADRALREALQSRLQIRSTTIVFEGGRDNSDALEADKYQFMLLARKEMRERRRLQEYRQAYDRFLSDLLGIESPAQA